jgi:hypothetical protein
MKAATVLRIKKWLARLGRFLGWVLFALFLIAIVALFAFVGWKIIMLFVTSAVARRVVSVGLIIVGVILFVKGIARWIGWSFYNKTFLENQ